MASVVLPLLLGFCRVLAPWVGARESSGNAGFRPGLRESKGSRRRHGNVKGIERGLAPIRLAGHGWC